MHIRHCIVRQSCPENSRNLYIDLPYQHVFIYLVITSDMIFVVYDRVWGVNCGTCEPKYQSWRDMYLQRPRLRYNGCYISKTSYIRDGENSFQDRFYRPWHLVEYFRYLRYINVDTVIRIHAIFFPILILFLALRFFPEGRVLMLTSTDEAQSCVNSLRSRVPRNSSVLIGHYRLHDNFVTLMMKKQEIKGVSFTYRRNKREPVHDSGEQTFHIVSNKSQVRRYS